MRRLFIPLIVILAATGCDGSEPTDPDLVGTWTLISITAASGDAVAGPIGSTVTFDSDGTFALDSGNDCSGQYSARASGADARLTLDFETCTEIGTTAESDLAVLFGFWDRPSAGPPVATYAIAESLPLHLTLDYSTPEADLRLRFRAD